MCGIVGSTAQNNIVQTVLEGLKRLEYRGYDSAGIAWQMPDGSTSIKKLANRVASLQAQCDQANATTAIAHTRWATHGQPNQQNAHPHQAGKVTLVHNGIIENDKQLKSQLPDQGQSCLSETDSEIIAQLINTQWDQTQSFVANVQHVVSQLKGAYGLVIMHQDFPNELVAVKSGSPLVIGYGEQAHYVASDSLSLQSVTQQFSFLQENDIVHMTPEMVTIYNANTLVKRQIDTIEQKDQAIDKNGYQHFMLKEIYQQPIAISETIKGVIAHDGSINLGRFGSQADKLFAQIKHVKIIACGTSYHAGLVARYWLEAYAQVSCDVEIASENRYRQQVVPTNTLLVAISQSGETADTLAALKQAKDNGYLATLGICNVANSAMAQLVDMIFMTQAGIEIGVASTKAFTTQLASLLLLTCGIAQAKQVQSIRQIHAITTALQQVPAAMDALLEHTDPIQTMAQTITPFAHTLFLGRSSQYPIALEGALKLKEISYIHAEGYPAGELKHGPLALIDTTVPTIATIANDALVDKVLSNLKEVQARQGAVYLIIDQTLKDQITLTPEQCIVIDTIDSSVSPIMTTVPLQLLSYYVAVNKGTDIDKPRNLAKSVTVE